MAKNKGKAKGKKKFKTIAKTVEADAKVALDDTTANAKEMIETVGERAKGSLDAALPRAKSLVQDEREAISSAVSQKVTKIEEDLLSKLETLPLEAPDAEQLYDLADLFKIFADSTRLKILYSLIDGGKCVADISAAAGVSQSATSHQLRSMKQVHVVKHVRDGKQVIYSLANDGIRAMLAQGMSIIEE